jgi:hypothetical protein
MDFYLIPLKELEGEENGFYRGKYTKVYKAICNLQPGSESYYSALRNARRLVSNATRFFSYSKKGSLGEEIKKSLAVMEEAMTRELEEWGIAIGKIPRSKEEAIAKRRKYRRSILEAGYGVEFI